MAKPTTLAKAIPAPAIEKQHPIAPDRLTDEQREIWNDFYVHIAADWIPDESLALLEALCIHISSHRRTAKLIQLSDKTIDAASVRLSERLGVDTHPDEDDFGPDISELFKHHNRLLTALKRDQEAIASLMVKLRLAVSSTRAVNESHADERANPEKTDVANDY